MNDVLDKKNLPSYSELPHVSPPLLKLELTFQSHTPFPSGLEGVSKKYEAELAVAYRINQELETKLMVSFLKSRLSNLQNKSLNNMDSKLNVGTNQSSLEVICGKFGVV